MAKMKREKASTGQKRILRMEEKMIAEANSMRCVEMHMKIKHISYHFIVMDYNMTLGSLDATHSSRFQFYHHEMLITNIRDIREQKKIQDNHFDEFMKAVKMF